MRFEKGKAKTGGIQKGQLQQKTKDWYTIAEIFKTEFTGRMVQIMHDADDETFARHYKDLLEYFKPKMVRQEIEERSTVTIDLSKLTDEQLERLGRGMDLKPGED